MLRPHYVDNLIKHALLFVLAVIVVKSMTEMPVGSMEEFHLSEFTIMQM